MVKRGLARARAESATSRSDPVLCCSSQEGTCVSVCVRGKCLRQLLSHVDETLFIIRFQGKAVERKDAVLFSMLSDQRWFLWDLFP